MAAPKCKICGKSHYGMCNPKDFPELSESEKTNNKVIPEKATQSTTVQESRVESGPVEKPATTAESPSQLKGPAYDRNAPARVKRWREANREKYNADQRERMREYRRRNK